MDDIILTSSKASCIQEVVDELNAVLEMKDMGKLTYFLGLQIDYNAEGDISLSQKKYAKELLHKAGMSSCRPCLTPSKPHTQVLQSEGTLLSDPSLYRRVVGALQYLTFTRPDLSYAVNFVCQYMTAPTELHWLLVKRILRYIQGTLDHGLKFFSGPWQLHALSDADWPRAVNTIRSTTRFMVFLGPNPISWQSKKQTSVARSSTEADYRSLAHTSAEIACIRQVLQDLKVFCLSNLFCIVTTCQLLHSVLTLFIIHLSSIN